LLKLEKGSHRFGECVELDRKDAVGSRYILLDKHTAVRSHIEARGRCFRRAGAIAVVAAFPSAAMGGVRMWSASAGGACRFDAGTAWRGGFWIDAGARRCAAFRPDRPASKCDGGQVYSNGLKIGGVGDGLKIGLGKFPLDSQDPSEDAEVAAFACVIAVNQSV
jgi:hypothetical protein